MLVEYQNKNLAVLLFHVQIFHQVPIIEKEKNILFVVINENQE